MPYFNRFPCLALLYSVAVPAFVCSCASAQITIEPPYSSAYTGVVLGMPPGVATPYGGLVFAQGDPNTLLIGGDAESSGDVYSIGVARGPGNHITGFSGTGTVLSSATGIQGGLCYAPDGDLFFLEYSNNSLGEIEPGSDNPNKIQNLSSLAHTEVLDGVNFVPPGIPGAGSCKIDDYESGDFFNAALSPDAGGATYTVTSLTETAKLSYNTIGGFVYVGAGNPQFSSSAMLMTNSNSDAIYVYNVDSSGNPIDTTSPPTFAELTGPSGVTFDPVTGDLLISGYSSAQIYEVQGFATPASLQSLSPSTATSGGPAFTLAISGSNFVPSADVYWNSTHLTVLSETSTKITASVPKTLIANAGTDQVTVVNPNVAPSNALPFTVTQAVPTLTTLSPATTAAGGAAFTLTVNGNHFIPSETVDWNGSPLTTTFVSKVKLTATVPASLIAAFGIANITVVLPGSGGVSSSSDPFRISVTSIMIDATLTQNATTGEYTAKVGVKNTGNAAATNVTIYGANLGNAGTDSTLPISEGTIAAGGQSFVTVTFPSSAGSPGSMAYLELEGAYTGDSFDKSVDKTLP